jgi:hypothetical protein
MDVVLRARITRPDSQTRLFAPVGCQRVAKELISMLSASRTGRLTPTYPLAGSRT